MPEDKQQCRKCGGEMKPGIATGQTVDCGDEGTCSPAGPGFVQSCLKCSACGWSVAAPAPQPAMPESAGNKSLTHEAISKALSEGAALTHEQRSQLLGLVADDKVWQREADRRREAGALDEARCALLQAELQGKSDAIQRLWRERDEAQARCAQMAGALEKAEKDAARYRQVRLMVYAEAGDSRVRLRDITFGAGATTLEMFDSAIDTVIADD